MIYETITLGHGALLTAYCPENTPEIDIGRTRPSIVICPGGAYGFLSDREAEPVALKFLSLGFNVFILRYHIAPNRYPAPQIDLAEAVLKVRERAADYHARKDAVAVMGFSAGGHLACSLGVLWNSAEIFKPLGCAPEEIRPDAMVLCYPVISAGSYAHRESFENLLGTQDVARHQRLSLENRVSKDTVPAFLWHTAADDAVPVQNSLLLAAALAEHGIPLEMHIYPRGAHGLSTADFHSIGTREFAESAPECQGWVELCARWLNQRLGGYSTPM